MKKVISFILCLALVFSLNICAFAEETANDQTTVLKLTVDPSLETYTLSIPAELEIDPTTKTATLTVSASEINLLWSDSLCVDVSSENLDANGANLINTNDETKKIHYKMKDGDNTPLNSSTEMITAFTYKKADDTQQTKSAEGSMAITVDGTYPASGTYTDTLTFTVRTAQKPN